MRRRFLEHTSCSLSSKHLMSGDAASTDPTGALDSTSIAARRTLPDRDPTSEGRRERRRGERTRRREQGREGASARVRERADMTTDQEIAHRLSGSVRQPGTIGWFEEDHMTCITLFLTAVVIARTAPILVSARSCSSSAATGFRNLLPVPITSPSTCARTTEIVCVNELECVVYCAWR